ncbi:MAG: hypothetical protein GJ680_03155 [Alteromonadaceae bacterium]|nr:hypothetical protein [Alteromonadaceae bacterium]
MKTLTLKIIAALASLLLSFPNQMRANESMQGIWQHAGKPAELLINLQSGLVTVHSHQLSPDSIGLTVMKNIVVTNKKQKLKCLMATKVILKR